MFEVDLYRDLFEMGFFVIWMMIEGGFQIVLIMGYDSWKCRVLMVIYACFKFVLVF